MSDDLTNSFKSRVIAITSTIPFGKVMSYGQVAALAGSPRAARQTGWALSSLPLGSKVPWWRVVSKSGYLSIKKTDLEAKITQKLLLEAEGVVVSGEFVVDMANYQVR